MSECVNCCGGHPVRLAHHSDNQFLSWCELVDAPVATPREASATPVDEPNCDCGKTGSLHKPTCTAMAGGAPSPTAPTHDVYDFYDSYEGSSDFESRADVCEFAAAYASSLVAAIANLDEAIALANEGLAAKEEEIAKLRNPSDAFCAVLWAIAMRCYHSDAPHGEFVNEVRQLLNGEAR
jgi:hypothetical protein